jgi:hypothetical protein
MLRASKNILNKISVAIVSILLSSMTLSSVAFAQEAKLDLRQIGYGGTYQDILLQFTNAGNVTLSDITIYINGQANKTIAVSFSSGRVIPFTLQLAPGTYLVEARTPEGAYASLGVTASLGKVIITTTTAVSGGEEAGPGISDLIQKNILWVVLGIAVPVLVICIWLIKKGSSSKR